MSVRLADKQFRVMQLHVCQLVKEEQEAITIAKQHNEGKGWMSYMYAQSHQQKTASYMYMYMSLLHQIKLSR